VLQNGFPLREGGVDLTRLTAVDVHVHVEADHDGHMSLPEDFAADFAELDIKPQVRPKILKDNAGRVLNLGPPPGGVSR
jgi:hypothetical protein